MTASKRLCLTLLTLGTLLPLAGCGYQTTSLQRPGIHTVACPIWTRGQDIYRRDIEIRLTKAIVDRVNMTGYKVVDGDRADTKLTGSIDAIDQKVLSNNPDTGDAREMQIAFTVSFRWEDLRTGDVLVERKNFIVATTYLPTDPYNERFFRGSEDALDEIARRVVETMEADWGGGT